MVYVSPRLLLSLMWVIGESDLRSCLVLSYAAVLILALLVGFTTRSANWRYPVALHVS